jgi:hypothetical protein
MRASSESRSASVSVSDAVAISSSGVLAGSGDAGEDGGAAGPSCRPLVFDRKATNYGNCSSSALSIFSGLPASTARPTLGDLHDAALRPLHQWGAPSRWETHPRLLVGRSHSP